MNPEIKIEVREAVVNLNAVIAQEKAKKEVMKLNVIVAGRKNSHYPEGDRPHY